MSSSSSTTCPSCGRDDHSPASAAAWVGSTRRAEGTTTGARHTSTALADHRLAHGWTTTDLAAALRPQEDA